MRTLTTVSIALVAFTACLSAQNTIVSPIGATSTEGSGSNAFPFTSSVIRRYQQIHSDLGSGAKLIKQLSFRANGGSTNYTGTRAMDIELALCDAGDYASISNNFSANYIGSPTTVISRTIVNLGPQGQASIPSPFQGMDLSFSPYVHSGTNSLLW
ncbi:MAG: hypothetical protein KDC87_00420, partial [Planctomycetes bacterium]|nr:hypothetical protein [Planctomycetota bacterium]